jgi:hypothetical protein
MVMGKFFGNLHLVLLVGLVLTVAVIVGYAPEVPASVNAVFRWLHVFFGILWIGLLYYLNFVQVPAMPADPRGASESSRRATRGRKGNSLSHSRGSQLVSISKVVCKDSKLRSL